MKPQVVCLSFSERLSKSRDGSLAVSEHSRDARTVQCGGSELIWAPHLRQSVRNRDRPVAVTKACMRQSYQSQVINPVRTTDGKSNDQRLRIAVTSQCIRDTSHRQGVAAAVVRCPIPTVRSLENPDRRLLMTMRA